MKATFDWWAPEDARRLAAKAADLIFDAICSLKNVRKLLSP